MKTPVTLFLGLCVLSLASCKVDERYSLDKLSKMDSSMRLFEDGLSLPVGYSKPISIDNAVGKKNDKGEITYPEHFNADGKGNYFIDYSGQAGNFDFSIPKVVDFGNPVAETVSLTMNNPYPAGKTGSGTFDITSIDTQANIQLSNNLGENILDIRDIAVSSDVIMNVSTNGTMSGDVFAKIGDFILFPSYLALEKNDQSSTYEVQEGSKIVFKSDFRIPDARLNLKLSKINVAKAIELGKAEITPDHRLIIQDKIQFKLNLCVNGSYRLASGLKLSLTFTTNLTAPKVESAEIRIKASATAEASKFDFKLPDNISPDSNIDLEDPIIKFNINCNRGGTITGEPFRFKANVKLVSYTGDGRETKKTINIKDVGINEGKNIIILSRKGGKAVSAEEIDCIVPALNELISGTIPDAIGITDISIEVINKDEQGQPIFYTVSTSLKPSITCTYNFTSFLEFRKNASITMNLPVSEAKVDLSSMKPENLYLDFDFENAIPFKLLPDMILTIKDGGEFRDIHVWGENLVILPGNPDKPYSTHATLKIESVNGFIESLEKIGVKFEGQVTDENAMLSRSQYVRLNNIAIGLTGGISLTIEK